MTEQGYWDGMTFILPIRIYYEDTDLAGIVHHPNYLKFAERTRTEMIRFMGFDATGLKQDEGVHFVVRHCEIQYLSSARVDEVVHVTCTVAKFGTSSITVKQDVLLDGNKLTEIQIQIVCINSAGKVSRVPSRLRVRYEEMITLSTISEASA